MPKQIPWPATMTVAIVAHMIVASILVSILKLVKLGIILRLEMATATMKQITMTVSLMEETVVELVSTSIAALIVCVTVM